MVKNFELPEEEETTDIEDGSENIEVETNNGEELKTGPFQQKGKTGPLGKPDLWAKPGRLVTRSSAGYLRLLNKMTESGLLVACQDNRMRFLHPVLEAIWLGGRSRLSTQTVHLLQQPDWAGNFSPCAT